MANHAYCSDFHCRLEDGAYCPAADRLPTEVIAQRQQLLEARDSAEQDLLDFEAAQAFLALRSSYPNVGSVRIRYEFEGNSLASADTEWRDSAGQRLDEEDMDEPYSEMVDLVSGEARHIVWRRGLLHGERDQIVVPPTVDSAS